MGDSLNNFLIFLSSLIQTCENRFQDSSTHKKCSLIDHSMKMLVTASDQMLSKYSRVPMSLPPEGTA